MQILRIVFDLCDILKKLKLITNAKLSNYSLQVQYREPVMQNQSAKSLHKLLCMFSRDKDPTIFKKLKRKKMVSKFRKIVL